MKPFSPKTAADQRHAGNDIKPEIEVFDLVRSHQGEDQARWHQYL